MSNKFFATFGIVSVLLAGCATTKPTQPVLASTCQLEETAMATTTCREGAETCFVCYIGPTGNTKQTAKCMGGRWVPTGQCPNCP